MPRYVSTQPLTMSSSDWSRASPTEGRLRQTTDPGKRTRVGRAPTRSVKLDRSGSVPRPGPRGPDNGRRIGSNDDGASKACRGLVAGPPDDCLLRRGQVRAEP